MVAAVVSIRTSHQNQPLDQAQVTTNANNRAISMDPMKIAPRPAALPSSVGNESGTALPPRQATMPYTGSAITPGSNISRFEIFGFNSQVITPKRITRGKVRQNKTA